jgi:bifunctional UDP-N-acetylglucosamine pyrophosphorylase / glucosamine-1-phosphate N-acetyltransferase
MPDILNLSEQTPGPIPGVRSKDWTAIIPAAGHAKRLGSAQPKILYPILGRPILSWLVELLDPFCGSFVFVLSPSARASVEAVLLSFMEKPFSLAIQNEPRGMADAVLCSEPFVKTPSCLVLWGDQILLRKETVANAVARHEDRPGSPLTLPTVLREKPYIHFARDERGRITRVYQAREEKIPVLQGESDCGLFLFNTAALFKVLRQEEANPEYHGRETKEYNLLPLIPLWDKGKTGITTLRIEHRDESMGINTPEEARAVEELLRLRKGYETK